MLLYALTVVPDWAKQSFLSSTFGPLQSPGPRVRSWALSVAVCSVCPVSVRRLSVSCGDSWSCLRFDPLYLNNSICCVSSASVPFGSGPARLLRLAEHAGIRAGVLLYDWVVALISCLVIRCVDIQSLLKTTLFKLLPCVKLCCVTSVGCAEGALGTLGGLILRPFRINHLFHKSVKRHWATRAVEPACFVTKTTSEWWEITARKCRKSVNPAEAPGYRKQDTRNVLDVSGQHLLTSRTARL